MFGHRHYSRRRSSTSRSSMRVSTRDTSRSTDDDVHGCHRRLKRSSASLSVGRSQALRHPTSWVLLNRASAWRDGFPDDRTKSAMSRTSKGDEISVSFELVEPPGISVLTVDWPDSTTRRKYHGSVIAAHRDVVLLEFKSYQEKMSPPDNVVVDLFVYQVSRDPSGHRRLPSLMLLPSPGVSARHWLLKAKGIVSCTDNDDESPSFVVAYLEKYLETNDACLFRSRTGQWQSFHNLHVHGANSGRDLRWWRTDAVIPHGRRCMIWVDYFRGMLLMDLSSSHSHSQSETNTPLPPRLQYVPLPVNRVEDPEHIDFGFRGCPKDSRSICVTRYGIKFISIDNQQWSNFGLGNHHVRTWSHRFRITTWSLHEHDYTWTRDMTMHEREFWDAFGFGHRFGFPQVQPRFPVIDMDNPDVVVFRLEKNIYNTDAAKWMIEVDLRKKVLLSATAYSKKGSGALSDNREAINSARVYSYDPITSELPSYMDGAQSCKKRRQ